MVFNLKAMTNKELTKLKHDVTKALKTAEIRMRKDALKAAEKAAAEYGYKLTEISPPAKLKAKVVKRHTKRKTKAKSKPKYKNPANPEQTWSGRGRKPHWINDALAGGADITDLEI